MPRLPTAIQHAAVRLSTRRKHGAAYAAAMSAPPPRARLEDVHELACAMPHVTVERGPHGNPVYQVPGAWVATPRGNPRRDSSDRRWLIYRYRLPRLVQESGTFWGSYAANAAVSGRRLKPGYQRWKLSASWSLRTRVRT
jgi:hypothetical protein